MRHPRRSRSVSVGPQSAADAHEALAWRRELRREKQASASGAASGAERVSLRDWEVAEDTKLEAKANGFPSDGVLPAATLDNDATSATIESIVIASNGSLNAKSPMTRTLSQDRRENEKEEREMFSLLEKPRVRYDVEVITKLIVYSGKF